MCNPLHPAPFCMPKGMNTVHADARRGANLGSQVHAWCILCAKAERTKERDGWLPKGWRVSHVPRALEVLQKSSVAVKCTGSTFLDMVWIWWEEHRTWDQPGGLYSFQVPIGETHLLRGAEAPSAASANNGALKDGNSTPRIMEEKQWTASPSLPKSVRFKILFPASITAPYWCSGLLGKHLAGFFWIREVQSAEFQITENKIIFLQHLSCNNLKALLVGPSLWMDHRFCCTHMGKQKQEGLSGCPNITL